MLARHEQSDDFIAGAVAEADPDEPGRMAVEETALIEIRIFRNEREAMGPRVVPDGFVGQTLQPAIADMGTFGKSAASNWGSFGERFSSKSSFMRHDVQPTVTLGRKRETRLDVFGGEIGKISQNLGRRHAATEVVEHVRDRDARAAKAWFSAADTRVDGDAFTVIHARKVVRRQLPSQGVQLAQEPRERDLSRRDCRR